jgi:hypothetical protein
MPGRDLFTQRVPRRSRLAWWYQLSSPAEPPLGSPFELRDRVRRARQASTLLLGFLAILVFSIPIGATDPATLIGLLSVLGACLVAVFLNRRGHVNTVGVVLVVAFGAALAGSFLGAPGGKLDTVYVPVYDLFVLSELLAVTILPPVAVFPVAIVNSAFIAGDLLLQPPTPALRALLESPDGYGTVFRPVALQFFVAIVAYLWVRSAVQSLRRADRAEEIALLEHQIADQKRQLDIGIQQILDTHVRAANGDFNARAPQMPGSALWQIGASLNNLLARLHRAGVAEFRLQRTEEELGRLAAALRDAQAGRRPLWPAPSHTSVDTIIEIIAGPQRPVLPPHPPSGQSSSWG